jgi:S-adenosylmethionine decarboxylase
MGNSAGKHLILDGFVHNSEVFNQTTIETMFTSIIQALEMTPLGAPHVYEVPVDPAILQRVKETGQFEDSGGITAVVVISTSHLSIHCWPAENFFSLDAFSCKDFDHEKALSVIHETLGTKSTNITVINRTKPTC